MDDLSVEREKKTCLYICFTLYNNIIHFKTKSSTSPKLKKIERKM